MPDVFVRALVDGAIFAIAVWITTRLVPGLSPGVRAMLWWFAAVRFVLSLISLPALPLAVLPPEDRQLAPAVPRISSPAPAPDDRRASSTGEHNQIPSLWPLVVALWAAGVAVSIGRGVRRWSLRQRILRSSTPAGGDLQEMTTDLGRLVGLRRIPDVRGSTQVESPLITGLLRPVILLPQQPFSELPTDRQRMAICHELVHLKRGDLWLGLVPAAAERLFFFHPLARLAAREYLFWREVACDRAVIGALGAAPQSYGRLLLDLGVASERSALAAAGAAWSFSSLKRRIVMLQRPSTPTFIARLVAVFAVAAAITGLLPVRLVSRPAAAALLPPSTGGPSAQGSDAQDRNKIEFIFLHQDQTTMSGSTRDIERVRRHRKGNEDLLWFRRDGQEYIVRDPSILNEVKNLWAPISLIGNDQGEIGAKQGRIGERQAAIGAKQAEIGAQQAAVGSRQAGLGARQAALAARQTSRLTDAERTEIDRSMRALDDDMRALDREMRALDLKMREFDKPMDDLSRDMDVLGREMDALSEKMEEASSKAEAGMRSLLDRAIASGAAQLVR